MNIFLVGCRGAGKSTIGPMVAKRLGMPFVDLDAMITEEAGCTIKEIFAAEGEAGFRKREHAACQKVRKARRHVIALGGGSLSDPDNHPILRRSGKFVWLRAPAAVLWSRIKNDAASADNRPDLTANGGLAELEALLSQRESQYQAAANHIVDTVSVSPDEIVDAIELWFHANDGHSQ